MGWGGLPIQNCGVSFCHGLWPQAGGPTVVGGKSITIVSCLSRTEQYLRIKYPTRDAEKLTSVGTGQGPMRMFRAGD